MKRCTTILIMLVAFLVACNTPRKACRKADRLIARAVWKCPDVLKQDSALVTTPADSASYTAKDTLPNLDSLLAACATLNAALMSERTARPRPKYDETSVPMAAPVAGPSVATAMKRLQASAAPWRSFEEQFGRITIKVKNAYGQPLLTVIDPGETQKVPCPPTVNKTVVTGVAEWYRTYFWMTIGVVVLLLAAFKLENQDKAKH